MADDANPGLGSGLKARIVSGVVLLAVAVTAIWLGGLAFMALVAAAVMLVLWEWGAMHLIAPRVRIGGMILLVAICWLSLQGQAGNALWLLAAGLAASLLVGAAARQRDYHWFLAGLVYAGLPGIALIFLRTRPDGLVLVLWTCTLVWATDIFAYFSGRAIGGPKIWPAISPKKTWAGLAGGMVAAALASVLIARWAGWLWPWWLMLLTGAVLAVVAQAGDFFESWLKRRAGVKDSGNLLPGHGGIMDRVDGLIPVSCVIALLAALA